MNANVALNRSAKALNVRVNNETVAVATTVMSCIGAVAACVADMDAIMYLCAVTGLAGAMGLDKPGNREGNVTEKGGAK